VAGLEPAMPVGYERSIVFELNLSPLPAALFKLHLVILVL